MFLHHARDLLSPFVSIVHMRRVGHTAISCPSIRSQILSLLIEMSVDMTFADFVDLLCAAQFEWGWDLQIHSPLILRIYDTLPNLQIDCP